MGKALSKADANTWGMIAHLSALAGIIFPLGIVLGPLVVWLMKRNDSSFVDSNAKEALNFQITVLIVTLILAFLSGISNIFLLLAAIIGLAGLGLAVYGGLQAKKGDQYQYPFAFRLIK